MAETDLSGEVLDRRYRILERMSSGAMGVGGYKRLELRGPTRTITSMKETIQWAKARLLGRSAS